MGCEERKVVNGTTFKNTGKFFNSLLWPSKQPDSPLIPDFFNGHLHKSDSKSSCTLKTHLNFMALYKWSNQGALGNITATFFYYFYSNFSSYFSPTGLKVCLLNVLSQFYSCLHMCNQISIVLSFKMQFFCEMFCSKKCACTVALKLMPFGLIFCQQMQWHLDTVTNIWLKCLTTVYSFKSWKIYREHSFMQQCIHRILTKIFTMRSMLLLH